MTENWLFLTIYFGIWVFILILMGTVAFKKYKKYSHKKKMKAKLRLVKGECIGKVRCGHKCNND